MVQNEADMRRMGLSLIGFDFDWQAGAGEGLNNERFVAHLDKDIDAGLHELMPPGEFRLTREEYILPRCLANTSTKHFRRGSSMHTPSAATKKRSDSKQAIEVVQR
jgi:hypothetical protein